VGRREQSAPLPPSERRQGQDSRTLAGYQGAGVTRDCAHDAKYKIACYAQIGVRTILGYSASLRRV